MHCIGSNLCFWIWTILRETVDSLYHGEDAPVSLHHLNSHKAMYMTGMFLAVFNSVYDQNIFKNREIPRNSVRQTSLQIFWFHLYFVNINQVVIIMNKKFRGTRWKNKKPFPLCVYTGSIHLRASKWEKEVGNTLISFRWHPTQVKLKYSLQKGFL